MRRESIPGSVELGGRREGGKWVQRRSANGERSNDDEMSSSWTTKAQLEDGDGPARGRRRSNEEQPKFDPRTLSNLAAELAGEEDAVDEDKGVLEVLRDLPGREPAMWRSSKERNTSKEA